MDRRHFSTDYLTPPDRRDYIKPRDREKEFKTTLLMGGLFLGALVIVLSSAYQQLEKTEKTQDILGARSMIVAESGAEAFLTNPSQEQAKKLLEDPQIFKFKDIVVVGDNHDNDISTPNVVFMRDKPYSVDTEFKNDGKTAFIERAGLRVGTLPAGTKITEAVLIAGGNPHFAGRGDRIGSWLAFSNPNNPGQIVFAVAELCDAPGLMWTAPLPIQAGQGLTAGR